MTTKIVILLDHFESYIVFLPEEAPILNEKELYLTTIDMVKTWKHSNFIYKNFIFNRVDTLYITYIVQTKLLKYCKGPG